MPKQKGRRVPDRQISGEKSQLLDIPKGAQGEMLEYIRAVEKQAHDGYAKHGRGFLLYTRYADDPTLVPMIMYIYPESPHWKGFARETDVTESVKTYDPATQFVLFEGAADVDTGQMFDIQVSVCGYMVFGDDLTSAA